MKIDPLYVWQIPAEKPDQHVSWKLDPSNLFKFSVKEKGNEW